MHFDRLEIILYLKKINAVITWDRHQFMEYFNISNYTLCHCKIFPLLCESEEFHRQIIKTFVFQLKIIDFPLRIKQFIIVDRTCKIIV